MSERDIVLKTIREGGAVLSDIIEEIVFLRYRAPAAAYEEARRDVLPILDQLLEDGLIEKRTRKGADFNLYIIREPPRQAHS